MREKAKSLATKMENKYESRRDSQRNSRSDRHEEAMHEFSRIWEREFGRGRSAMKVATTTTATGSPRATIDVRIRVTAATEKRGNARVSEFNSAIGERDRDGKKVKNENKERSAIYALERTWERTR